MMIRIAYFCRFLLFTNTEKPKEKNLFVYALPSMLFKRLSVMVTFEVIDNYHMAALGRNSKVAFLGRNM